ncbi:MAG: VOC family protein [Pseudomonadota bacterium]
MTRGFTPRALGEIAIRCRAMAPMVRFYRDTIGLSILSGGEDAAITFFALGDSCAGHTAVLALFGPSANTRPGLHPEGVPETGARSSLHHLALSLTYAEQDAVIAWYEAQRLTYRVEHFEWIGWRGIFTQDPEGNTVELVAKNPDWTAPQDG